MTVSSIAATNNTNPRPEVWTITPELAQELLGHNTKNRNVRGAHVESLARDMRAGKWQMTGEAIKRAADGTILDGQHRLLACIKAGVPFTTIVVSNVDRSAQAVMDSGASRRVSDELTIRGWKNTSRVAAAARYALLQDLGSNVDTRHSKYTPTNTEVLDYIDANPDLADACNSLARVSSIHCPPSVTFVAYWRLSKIDADDAERFFSDLLGGVRNGEGDPIFALAERFETVRRARLRVPQDQAYSAFIRAWNAWRTGRTLRTLPLVKDGRAIPAPSPV